MNSPFFDLLLTFMISCVSLQMNKPAPWVEAEWLILVTSILVLCKVSRIVSNQAVPDVLNCTDGEPG